MYLSKNRHILSGALLLSAFVRLGGSAVYAYLRYRWRDRVSAQPDMMNARLEEIQTQISVLQVLMVAVILLAALLWIRHLIRKVPRADRREWRNLQEETLGGDRASLPAEIIAQILQVWIVILVGAQILYDFTAQIYARIVQDVVGLFPNSPAGVTAMISLYNTTHGFKYQGMMVAMLLGFIMTGIFLRDGGLTLVPVLICVLYMAAFALLGMDTVTIRGVDYGIVWTSVIYHVMETLGMTYFALYLRVKYHGI